MATIAPLSDAPRALVEPLLCRRGAPLRVEAASGWVAMQSSATSANGRRGGARVPPGRHASTIVSTLRIGPRARAVPLVV